MTDPEIQKQIAESLDMNSDDLWSEALIDTIPEHRGLDDLSFEIMADNLVIDSSLRTFTFKNGTLSFSARLGSSSETDGVDVPVSKAVSGSGTFAPNGTRAVKILTLRINERINLLEEK